MQAELKARLGSRGLRIGALSEERNSHRAHAAETGTQEGIVGDDGVGVGGEDEDDANGKGENDGNECDEKLLF